MDAILSTGLQIKELQFSKIFVNGGERHKALTFASIIDQNTLKRTSLSNTGYQIMPVDLKSRASCVRAL